MIHNPITLASSLDYATNQLGLDALDAGMLLLHALGRRVHDRAYLVAYAHDALPDAAWSVFEALCTRRAAGEPTAYILGRKEFWGLDLSVSPATLIPRPDTEILVEWALSAEVAKSLRTDARVLDLGTGSGAIALALQKERPAWRVQASDLSAQALEVAKKNAAQWGLAVDFQQSHWFAQLAPALYDLIVSNPPYIAERDAHLAALNHEPTQALTSGVDGLDAIREIAELAPAFLRPKGWLLLEHGFDQSAAVARILRAQGFSSVSHRHDLGGHVRCTGGQWGG